MTLIAAASFLLTGLQIMQATVSCVIHELSPDHCFCNVLQNFRPPPPGAPMGAVPPPPQFMQQR